MTISTEWYQAEELREQAEPEAQSAIQTLRGLYKLIHILGDKNHAVLLTAIKDTATQDAAKESAKPAIYQLKDALINAWPVIRDDLDTLSEQFTTPQGGASESLADILLDGWTPPQPE